MRGFTLVELMTTIAIGSVLVGLAVGAYGQLRKDSIVRAAQGKVVTTLNQARLKALSTRETQEVTIDFAQDQVIDGQGRTITFKGVDLQAMAVGSCEPTNSSALAIAFTAKGSAVAAMIRFSSSDSDQVRYIVVNAVSGGVFLYEQCTGSGVYS